MGPLEEIAFWQRKTNDELHDVKMSLFRLEKPDPTPEPLPEIYINSSEVQRILKVSANSITAWAKEGLLTKKKNLKCPTNCFLVSEIFWLEKQRYTFLTVHQAKELIKKRKKELGY